MVGGPKTVPQEQRVAGCCKEKLRGSPSLRSLAVITRGNHKSNSLIRSLLGERGKHSLFAVCQPGTPRNHCLRPIEVEPLIRNNRTSEKQGTIREAEVGDGEGGKDVSFTLQTGSLLSPPRPELAPQPKGAGSGDVLWRGGWGLARGYPNPSHHAPQEHGATQPREASPGGKWEGWLWRRPAPGCCVLDPREGRTLLPCQQHLQNAAWMGSLQAPAEETQPSPRRGAALVEGAPLSPKSPQRGRKPPLCTGVNWDPNLAQLCNCGDPWGRGDPLWLLQGPQIPAGQAGIWGCWRWVWKVQELGSRICTTPPQCRGGKGGHTPALGMQNATAPPR